MTNKRNLTAIVAIDSNLGIGYKNQILFHNKKDMYIFKTYTNIMKNCLAGRVTYESLPPAICKTRDVYLMSRNSDNGFTSFDELPEDDYVVIGGSQIYKLLADKISTWVITTHKARAIDVDAWFDNDVYNSIISDSDRIVLYEDDEIIVNVYIR